MSFLAALQLVLELEGGWDPTGPSFDGVLQSTYAGFGFPGNVHDASPQQIAEVYNHLWQQMSVLDPVSGSQRSLFEMLPHPVDALAFQFYINIPPESFAASVQAAVLSTPDGRIGEQTLIAIRTSSTPELVRGILTSQILHYACHATSANLPGLLNRVQRARIWAQKTDE